MGGKNGEVGLTPSFGTTSQVRESLLSQATPEQASTILTRDAIVTKFCEERGIFKDEISIDQLLEIRALPELMNA